MFALFLLALVIIGGTVLIVVALRSGSRDRIAAPTFEPKHAADVATQVRGTRRRMALALCLYLAVGVVVTLDPLRLQPARWLGLGQALGVAIAAILVGLLLAASPVVAWPQSGGVRTADLTPRTGGSFGPRWGFTLPLASAGILVAVLVVMGFTSSADGVGLYRAFTIDLPDGSSSGTPYPGWFYGVPLMFATLGLALVVLLVLHRIASAPRPTAAELYSVDDALRRSVTAFIMLLSSSALLLYFGAVTAVAGTVTANTATQWTTSSDLQSNVDGVSSADYLPSYVQPTYGLGIAETFCGLALVAVSIVLLVLAAVTSTLRWATVVAEVEMVDA